MKHILAAIVIVFACSSAYAATAVTTAESPVGKLELKLHTVPDANKAGTFILDATLTNVTSGAVIAEPRIVFSADVSAISTLNDAANSVKVMVSSDSSKDQATVEVEYSVKGKLVFAPRVTLGLK